MSVEINENAEPVVNITENQRMISGITGGLLLALGFFGFGKSSFRRAIRMTAGSLLVMRAITGYCPIIAMKDKPGSTEPAESKNMVSG
jgi:uncharacterized membrane protein